MKYLKVIFPLILIVLLTACSKPKPKNTSNKTSTEEDSTKIVNNSISDDKNFVIHNLQSTLVIDNILKHDGNEDTKLYADMAHKTTFVELSYKQKQELVTPFMRSDIPIAADADVAQLTGAWFIAKQPKVGDFQPIVIRINGDDYTSLTLIILDKNDKYVTGYNIDGGFDAGPYTVGDSVTKINPIRYSTLNNKKIITTSIVRSYYPDSLKRSSIVDSDVFENIINTSGKIITRQIVKTVYRKLFNPKENLNLDNFKNQP